MERTQAEYHLKKTFGIDRFYDEQWQAISRILKGERILMIQRTGFGKSLCYQFPATQFKGLTVIFSPLIALMRDQVNSLLRKGIEAAYINCEQSPEENETVIQKAIKGQLKILYIAPERQENELWLEAVKKMNLSMVVIDEAHTISTWGHDFRPAFSRIINLVKLLPKHLPVLATTATATKRVQADIEKQIGGQLTTIRGSLIRDNFRLRVIRVKDEADKMLWLAENIKSLPGTGIIYSGTRVDTQLYADWLRYVGIDVSEYNAGFDAETRKEIEQGLMQNRWKCIVSTNALGMGVDKSDIRFVIHTQMPVSPIHYYQEIGRAGRDGLPAEIILFFNDSPSAKAGIPVDLTLPIAFIEGARPDSNKYERVISLLREEPLSEREIIKKANLKQNQVRVIKYDLINQGIAREVLYGKTKRYEYQYGASAFNYAVYDQLRKAKMEELNRMHAYVNTSIPRMKYLCQFLDSDDMTFYHNCDNTDLRKLSADHFNPDTVKKLEAFREENFPTLEVCETSYKQLTENGKRKRLTVAIPYPNVVEVLRNGISVGRYFGPITAEDFSPAERSVLDELIKTHIAKQSHLTDGVAASYYGVSHIGSAIHSSKYENGGNFPNFLLELTLKAFRKRLGKIKFDMILYVPPTHSGNLVCDFAHRLASCINVPVCDDVRKTRQTKEQKIFQNRFTKQENIAGAFEVNADVAGKTILLVDDIFDSGETLKEIGRVLTAKGAKYIVPIVIAKTVGGTL
jgi:ATP-dependent DNA helicase RecQ